MVETIGAIAAGVTFLGGWVYAGRAPNEAEQTGRMRLMIAAEAVIMGVVAVTLAAASVSH